MHTCGKSVYNRAMVKRPSVETHESCVVPYRLTHLGVEFCLVSEAKVNRWEFPKVRGEQDVAARALLDEVAASAGATGDLQGDGPMAQFVAARGGAPCRTSAYLMRVTIVSDSWPQQAARRRLWCLAEEARARLRRKPWRRLVDLALQSVDPRRHRTGTNGEQSTTP